MSFFHCFSLKRKQNRARKEVAYYHLTAETQACKLEYEFMNRSKKWVEYCFFDW